MEWALSPTGRPLRSRWVILVILYWGGAAASLAVAVWTGQLAAIGSSELLLLIRYGYWCLVLIVVASMVSAIIEPERIATSLVLGVLAVSLLRLVEAFALGETDSAQTRWLSPNDYGMSFSTFTPFLLWQAVAERGARRWFAIASVPLVLAALALNGSRSSWAGALLGGLVFLALLLLSRRLGAVRLLWPVAAGGLALALLAAVPSVGLANRWNTLSQLQSDKPFQTRLVLVEKGLLLFESRPLFGVGLGRFTAERADMDSSRTPWASVEQINSRSPHNAYVKVLAETGMAGTLPLVALLSILIITGIPASIALARSGETWGLAVMASMAGMCLHLGTLSGLTNTAPWFIFGLAAAVTERSRRRR